MTFLHNEKYKVTLCNVNTTFLATRQNGITENIDFDKTFTEEKFRNNSHKHKQRNSRWELRVIIVKMH